jgi:methylated-DNA-[protein]-cysteine S-methyltransferase
MQKQRSYVIFTTAWGYFGLAAVGKALYRTCLPMANQGDVKCRLLVGTQGEAIPDRDLFAPMQACIQAYFTGEKAIFSPSIPLALEEMTVFSRSVLKACAGVPLGETTDYAALASQAGSPRAARAVGNALARNPLPLIIPCHRIVARSGLIGGFSAPGGTGMKQRLLQHEAQIVAQ